MKVSGNNIKFKYWPIFYIHRPKYVDTLINRNLIEEWYVPCTLRCARGQEYECCAISD